MNNRSKKHILDSVRTKNDGFRETARLMANPVMSGRISCSVSQVRGCKVPNATTLAAMKEADEIIKRSRNTR